jgi:predicted Zn-dependent protease
MTIRLAPRACLIALAIALALALAAACAKNPVTGKRQFSLVSAGQELAIGREGHEAILAEYGRYDDQRVQAYVDSVGQALARLSHLPELEWHYTVLDDPMVAPSPARRLHHITAASSPTQLRRSRRPRARDRP